MKKLEQDSAIEGPGISADSSRACQVVNLDSLVQSEKFADNRGAVESKTRKITSSPSIDNGDEVIPRAMVGHDETIFARQHLYKRN